MRSDAPECEHGCPDGAPRPDGWARCPLCRARLRADRARAAIAAAALTYAAADAARLGERHHDEDDQGMLDL